MNEQGILWPGVNLMDAQALLEGALVHPRAEALCKQLLGVATLLSAELPLGTQLLMRPFTHRHVLPRVAHI